MFPLNREEVKRQVFYAHEGPGNLADTIISLSYGVKVKVVAGVAAAGTIDLGYSPTSILAVLAVTTATGAVAAKFLLAPTVNYTLATHILTCVTDQSADTLIVIYM